MSVSGSGRVCAISSCKNNQKKQRLWNQTLCEIHKEIHQECPCLTPFILHAFPKDESARLIWAKVTGRKNFIPKKHSRICSDHFDNGVPSVKFPYPLNNLGLSENSHIINCGNKIKSPEKCKVFRERSLGEYNTGLPEMKSALTESPEKNCTNLKETEMESLDSILTRTEMESSISNLSNPLKDSFAHFEIINPTKTTNDVSTQSFIIFRSIGTQWENPDPVLDHSYCKDPETLEVNRSFGVQVNLPLLSYNSMTNSDCIFYTGLQLELFLNLLAVLSNHITHLTFRMEVGNQFLIVMLRLRLGLLLEDLGRRFLVSTSLISNIIQAWLPIMAVTLKKLVYWLPREKIRASLPTCFKEFYPHTTCIIDCSEVFINRPSLLRARAETYSSYKGHNTVKFLVGIAPNGHDMFMSKGYGGRSSDKFIFNDSKIINYMVPGDEILADRGFSITDELLIKQIKLIIPASTRKKSQLTENDVVKTRRIANVRIHIERAIKKLKEFRILKYELNLSNLSKTIDDTLIICAALCNLKPLLIKDKNIN